MDNDEVAPMSEKEMAEMRIMRVFVYAMCFCMVIFSIGCVAWALL